MTLDNARTADRLLDMAEAMFAESGYESVSLRAISRACDANIAAIHYHFGSKAELLDRIFANRAGTMNTARLALLAACEAREGRSPMLHQVLEAYLRPSLIPPSGDLNARRFARLRAVIASEQADISRELIAKYFNEVSRKFIAAIADLTPHLTRNEVHWRFHFLLGAQYYTLSNPERIQSVAEQGVGEINVDVLLAEMVAFVAGGFLAPKISPAQLLFGNTL